MTVSAFTVLSEFKLEAGEFLLKSEQMQNSVERLSGAVDNALLSAKNMGIGLAMQFTNAQAGVGSLLYSILSSSDKFKNYQLSFVQIIDSNMEHLTGTIGTMNEKMMVSQKIMQDIQKDAQKFGLSATDLVAGTKGLSAILAPLGLAGDNFGMARTMSRNLLKTAPLLNVDPMEVQGQMMRAIGDKSGGQASMGDTLFRRLLGEAPEVFEKAKAGSAKQFNALDIAKRVNVLNDAMAKFTKNTEILEARANTMTGVIQKFKDILYGPFSVLKKIGDVIMPLLVQGLNRLADWIQKDGQKIVDNVAGVLKQLLEDPKKFFLGLMQVKSLASDLKTASSLASMAVFVMNLGHLITYLSGLPHIGPYIIQFVDFIKNIKLGGKLMELLNFAFRNLDVIVINLYKALRWIITGVAEFAGWIFVFLIPLQGLSRAIARMKLETVEWIANNIADITILMTDLGRSFDLIMTPIQDLIQGWEELFFFILGGTYILDGGKSALQGFSEMLRKFAEGLLWVWSVLRSVVAGVVDVLATIVLNILQFIENLKSGNIMDAASFGTNDNFGTMFKAMDEEFNKSFSRALNPTLDGNVDNAKVSQLNINNNITMTNNFKEVLQPDRIAFTIREQLEKASTNRTSAKGNTFAAKAAKAV